MTRRLSKVFRISPHVWKVLAGSNLYLVQGDSPIVIDTGDRADRRTVQMYLGRLVKLESVKKVIFTHLHYDHIGNFDLFPNATFYASKEEIEDFRNSPMNAVLKSDIAQKFNVALEPLESDSVFKMIPTPGHTRGSVCLYYSKDDVLFSGDTTFGRKITGRTDLPTSVPDEMGHSLMRLAEMKFKILCPGHDYE